MPRILLLLALAGLLAGKPATAQENLEMILPFYSENIRIIYNPSLLSAGAPAISERGLVAHFHALARTDYAVLLKSTSQARKALNLNDWLHYQLLTKALEKIYTGRPKVEKELACWFLLSQAGFDTRLAYLDDDVFLYAYSRDAIFEAPIIKDRGRSFVNLTNIHSGRSAQQALYLLNFQPNPEGRSFSFQLKQLPLLRPRLSRREARFFFRDKWHQLEVEVNETIREFMADYPMLEESQYLDVPLSSALMNSLLPQLKRMLEGKNKWEAAELLAAFTRSSFAYKEDKAHFGKSKPMVAEEVFLYPFSDCEDRTALFVRLAQELLGLPMLVLAYPGHLTVAVALPQTKDGFVRYKGKAYYVCDPTGPVDSATVGEIPQGYEDSPFEVIKSYE